MTRIPGHVTHDTIFFGMSDMTDDLRDLRADLTREQAHRRMAEILDEMAALVAEQRDLMPLLAGEIDRQRIVYAKVDPTAADRLERVRNPKLRLADIMEMTGRTKRTIYRWMDEQDFPRPEIIKKAAYWDADAVKAWWETNEENVGRWPAL